MYVKFLTYVQFYIYNFILSKKLYLCMPVHVCVFVQVQRKVWKNTDD